MVRKGIKLVDIFGRQKKNQWVVSSLQQIIFASLKHTFLLKMKPIDHPKYYEIALSSKESPHKIEQALWELLRLALSQPTHYHFLLQTVPWFTSQYLCHFHILQKILRIYQGLNKKAEKVAYNLLCEGMAIPEAQQKATSSLISLSKAKFDQKHLLDALRQNYPHKVLEESIHRSYLKGLLQMMNEEIDLRIQILEIILENLAQMDTEYEMGKLKNQEQIQQNSANNDDTSFAINAYQDTATSPIGTIRKTKSRDKKILSNNLIKLDELLYVVVKELQHFKTENDFKELIVAFQKILLVDSPRHIQLILYHLAETNTKWSKIFLTFLLGQTMDRYRLKEQTKVFNTLNCYLGSYLIMSQRITEKVMRLSLEAIIRLIEEELSIKQETNSQKSSNLELLFRQNYFTLGLMKTLILVLEKKESQYPSLREISKKIGSLLKAHQSILLPQYFLHPNKDRNSKNLGNQRSINLFSMFQPTILPRFGSVVNQCFKKGRIAVLKEEEVKLQAKEEGELDRPLQKKVKKDLN